MNAGKETIKKSCEARKDQEKPKNAVERFNRFETAMSTRLEVMRSVKPIFVKFYATLSEKQQKAVDGPFTRGRRSPRGHATHPPRPRPEKRTVGKKREGPE